MSGEVETGQHTKEVLALLPSLIHPYFVINVPLFIVGFAWL